MTKIYNTVLAISLFLSFQLNAQVCDSLVPVFNVNLSGQPDSTWISPPVQRLGHCCNADSIDRCIEFIVTVDSAARSIWFNRVCGNLPIGPMYYKVNCGQPIPLGDFVCLNGIGPHVITFCRPGNNTECYAITSFDTTFCVFTSSQKELINTNSSFKVSPNPFHTSFTLNCTLNSVKSPLKIYNVIGGLVQSQIITSMHQQVSLNAKPGIYFIEVDGRVQKMVMY
jgi:hypothetical protein